ncbi:MAG TPA: ABC transporter permease [Methyloceanibacter sp.]|nr:ABC transporter permease [Methyloceanibacter sp.]
MTSTVSEVQEPAKPTLVVRPLTLNTFRYLYRCARAIKYIPGLGQRFLMDLYHQTILGWWWLVIRALLPTLGIIAIFQHVPAFKPEGLPYGLYVISGMLLWTILSTTLLRSTRSLRRTRGLAMKLAIPKLVFVLASAAIPLVYFCIFAAVLIIGIAIEYLSSGIMYLKFGWNLLLLPIPLGLVFLLCIGIASFTSVALLFARDARFIIPLVTQLWFYFTPIIYTIDIMPPSWQFVIMHVNPISALVEMLRWSLFGVGSWDALSLAVSATICLTVFLLGARFLMRTEWVLREIL